MIEPTESETLDTLDEFADSMIEIDKNIDDNPDIILNAPSSTPVGRLNETKANIELDINYYNKANQEKWSILLIKIKLVWKG